MWTVLGTEFGIDEGKSVVIVQALYSLKSDGASFGNHFADCMMRMGYEPCHADSDLWLKLMTRPDQGIKGYSYILCYVDDTLFIHHESNSMLQCLDKYFKLKPGSLGDPDIY